MFVKLLYEGGFIATLALVAMLWIMLQQAWMLLVNDGARDAMLLARLAGLGRPAAAAMVAALAEPLLWGEAGDAIACFDRLADPEIDAARRWWRLPPAYRDGLDALGGTHGQPLD